MTETKKKKIKATLKKKWKWFLGSGVFLTIGIVALLVGFNMTGWSIIDWLKSPYATTFFIIVGIGVLIILVAVITYKRSQLGGYDDERKD